MRKLKGCIGFTIVFLFLMSGILVGQEKKNTNLVPDESTAIKIAEAIWYPIYGKSIYNEKPFNVILKNNGKVWIVMGTGNKESEGGVAYIEIRKSDCKILKVYHSK